MQDATRLKEKLCKLLGWDTFSVEGAMEAITQAQSRCGGGRAGPYYLENTYVKLLCYDKHCGLCPNQPRGRHAGDGAAVTS